MCSEPKLEQPERCVGWGFLILSESNENWKRGRSVANKTFLKGEIVNFDYFLRYVDFSSKIGTNKRFPLRSLKIKVILPLVKFWKICNRRFPKIGNNPSIIPPLIRMKNNNPGFLSSRRDNFLFKNIKKNRNPKKIKILENIEILIFEIF